MSVSTMHVYGCILCVATVLQVEATVFELFQLPQNSHPHPQVILYPVTMIILFPVNPSPSAMTGARRATITTPTTPSWPRSTSTCR